MNAWKGEKSGCTYNSHEEGFVQARVVLQQLTQNNHRLRHNLILR
jgi:hypothetical protein